jgi:hypothetical protein
MGSHLRRHRARFLGDLVVTDKVHWRCFHCGETFLLAQKRWAQEHFGIDQGATPACLIRSAGENALLSALRDAEAQLEVYRAEDGKILRAMAAMQSDHATALRHQEELGYARGLRDARDAEKCPEPGEFLP